MGAPPEPGVRLLVHLGRTLHAAGFSAPQLEDALKRVAALLGARREVSHIFEPVAAAVAAFTAIALAQLVPGSIGYKSLSSR